MDSQIFKLVVRIFAVIFITNGLVLAANGASINVILTLFYLAVVIFICTLIPNKANLINYLDKDYKNLKIVFNICIILIYSLILSSLLGYYQSAVLYDRVSWIHNYGTGANFLIPTMMPLLFSYLLYSNRNILWFLPFAAVLIIDSTRISWIIYFILILIFKKDKISKNKVLLLLVLITTLIIFISAYRIIPSVGFQNINVALSKNLWHSFFGGYFLFDEHGTINVINVISEYQRRFYLGAVPGLDVVISTLTDRLTGTSLSLAHFESIFFNLHKFKYVAQLEVEMNSYYTGIIFFYLVGWVYATLCIIIVFYGAIRGEGILKKISQAWLILFLLVFDKWFINQHPGFSIFFIISIFYGVIIFWHDFIRLIFERYGIKLSFR